MAKIYGQLEKAQLELLASEPASAPTGYVFLDTAESVIKIKTAAGFKRLLQLTGTTKILEVTSAPSSGAGQAASIGSLAVHTTTGAVYAKTGSGDTAWSTLASLNPLVNELYEAPIEFAVVGTLNGIAETAALVYRVPRSLTVTAVRAMVKTAGSTGNLVVDVKKKTGAGAFSSILSSTISVAYTSGNYAVGSGTVTTTSLASGDILALDITSVQTNMVDFSVYVEVERA